MTPGDLSKTSEDDTAPRAGEIVVVATRIGGQIDAPQPPIVTLNEADIAAYGAASIAVWLSGQPAGDQLYSQGPVLGEDG